MRILMLFKCTSPHTSWEVRTLISHTDKKYTIKLCGAQGHTDSQMPPRRDFWPVSCVMHRDKQEYSPPKLCLAQGHTLPPTTQKPHPGSVSATGMRFELCGAQGQQLLFQCPILAHDFFRQFAIGFKPADFCQYALRPALCDHLLDFHRFFVFCIIEQQRRRDRFGEM